MHRRKLLQATLAVASAALLTGHSPYRQWYAFRAKHWIVVAAHDDAAASRIADLVAAELATRVPESQAMAAEAESEHDVVQLLRTRQLELGIVGAQAARDALRGTGSFAADGPVALRMVYPFGAHLLVVLEDYPPERAGQIAVALDDLPEIRDATAAEHSTADSPVPPHAGTLHR